ncbi:response regulator transcription factor [Pyxidicoccus sp. MSG2]|uniref:response regulator transcription factor n=1 Tax=Pyxidicoccus sp. MSG2 TaxID=2996790 RepID=UPI00226FAF82|nr:response regulator [Pyxidicoccus sp. MSG2]MCY1017161.1 response regulator [Pyxidicoccus sp. MSG2]
MPRRPVIVLAEDDAALRETMTEALELEGYRILACENGFAALKAFFAEPCVDVLVLDWRLPDIEGGDLIRLLHVQRELAELPVVLTTGLDLELPGFEGAVCLLRKPFAPGELSRLLSRLTHPGRCECAPPHAARVA